MAAQYRLCRADSPVSNRAKGERPDAMGWDACPRSDATHLPLDVRRLQDGHLPQVAC
jgi:hypothetical protein